MKAVASLLTGLIDYAGLFPPANQEMRPAIESYAAIRSGPDRSALGRFIVPVARLSEFEEQACNLLPREVDPWLLSVIVPGDVRAAGERMLKFNCHHWAGSEDGHAIIDVAELKASRAEEIGRQHEELPGFFMRYFEIPLGGDLVSLVRAIGRVGARAKVRTGGVRSDSIPPARELIAFMAACQREQVPFKATAGLHHPIRGSYNLTYEPNSATGTMYGFVNVFVAAALLSAGESEATAQAVLEEVDPSAFLFSDDAIAWRAHRISSADVRAMRERVAISFGSCSFREPVDELTQLISGHA